MCICWLYTGIPLIRGHGKYEADNYFTIYGSIISVLHGVKLLCDDVSSLILSERQVSCNFAFR